MKPYDLDVLIQNLKGIGLDVAEAEARAALVVVLDWVTLSAKASASLLDDLMLNFLPKVKEVALLEIDKINGKVG